MTLHYAASDYFATGEGMTVSVLITKALPRLEDYEEQPRWDLETMTYHPGRLKYDVKTLVEREFTEIFGDYLTRGVEHLQKDEFLKRYSYILPPFIAKKLGQEDDMGGNFHFHSQYHLNLS